MLHAQVLRPCVYKMRYDAEYDFDHAAEDEEEFLRYLQDLKGLLVNIAQLVRPFLILCVFALFAVPVPPNLDPGSPRRRRGLC